MKNGGKYDLKKLDTIKTPENWKRELLEQQKITKESSNTDFMKIKRMKWAMASLVLIVVCTMGITVGSRHFQSSLENFYKVCSEQKR